MYTLNDVCRQINMNGQMDKRKDRKNPPYTAINPNYNRGMAQTHFVSLLFLVFPYAVHFKIFNKIQQPHIICTNSAIYLKKKKEMPIFQVIERQA